MAKNMVMDREHASRLTVAVTNPSSPTSGSPVRFGNLTGVALTDKGVAGNISGLAVGDTTIDISLSVWDLSVAAVNDSGNSAVAKGDAIFYVDADTPHLSKKSSGYFFGFALETITSGSTDTINVMHVPSPGSGTLGSGTVGTTNLAANAVTAAKLSSTLATGFIPLPLAQARLISTNAIPNSGSADGGLVSGDTSPSLARVNGATDKQMRIIWAAGNAAEIQWATPYPPDLDDTAAIVAHFLARSAGATDTPVLTVSLWEGVGDTNAGGNTAALSNSIADKTVTMAASDVGAYPNVLSISVLPGTHATDAVWLYGAWLEYTRK